MADMIRTSLIALLALGCASAASDGTPNMPGNGDGGNNTPANGDGGTMAAGGSNGAGVENPTGDCVAPDDGSRAGYHAVESDTVWLPDCNNALSREYFRVFVQADGTAYMIPRPDGNPYVTNICETNHLLHDVVDSYTLCAEQVDVDRVNAMEVEDALRIAHYLNEQLVFIAEAEDVRPFAIPTDILELCQQDDVFRNGPMKERCDFEIEADQTGERTDIGWSHTGEQGVILAEKLNELYGINELSGSSGPPLCERLFSYARITLDLAIDAAPNSCEVDEDCAVVARASECHDSCAAVAAAAAEASIADTRAAIDESACQAFATANCPAVVHPPCVPLLAACVDGVCVEE